MHLNILRLLLLGRLSRAATSAAEGHQRALASHDEDGVSLSYFASLERMSRLVDITYCVGTTGISSPFSCVSRCADFPTLRLEKTWHTGVLLTDSCGYLAVDQGSADGTRGDWAHEPAIVVAFRGTYSVANTIVDLSTVPQQYVPYPAPDDGDEVGDGQDVNRCENCTVHMGFLASWRTARKLVLPVLKAVKGRYPDHAVHLIGHSLGGAVAALAALELRVSLGWDDVKVTTFGEPRVGNGALASYIDEAFGLDTSSDASDLEKLPYRRVTHVGDPVPLLPLSEWGFRQHAGETFITKPDLQPTPSDLRLCRGDSDPACLAGTEEDGLADIPVRTSLWDRDGSDKDMKFEDGRLSSSRHLIPARFRLWQLLFAHRDYFWRLGLCLPGGDPRNWMWKPYNLTLSRAEHWEGAFDGDNEL